MDFAVATVGDDPEWVPLTHALMSVEEVRAHWIANAEAVAALWLQSRAAQVMPEAVRRVSATFIVEHARRDAEAHAHEWLLQMRATLPADGRPLGIEHFTN